MGAVASKVKKLVSRKSNLQVLCAYTTLQYCTILLDHIGKYQ